MSEDGAGGPVDPHSMDEHSDDAWTPTHDEPLHDESLHDEPLHDEPVHDFAPHVPEEPADLGHDPQHHDPQHHLPEAAPHDRLDADQAGGPAEPPSFEPGSTLFSGPDEQPPDGDIPLPLVDPGYLDTHYATAWALDPRGDGGILAAAATNEEHDPISDPPQQQTDNDLRADLLGWEAR